jgi:lysophospholipid acyltransferase (LPLAT)-like uncharacterized protein
MRAGEVDAAFAVDGPRGPYGEPKPGAALAARRSGGVLVPMGSAVHRGKIFARAWDRFVLAWPFSRVVVVLGPPIAASVGQRDLAKAIEVANARAQRILAASGPKRLSLQGISGAAPASEKDVFEGH